MTTPIIDPSTLTEEQREAIKRQYRFAHTSIKMYDKGVIKTLEWLFGKDFLESSAKPPCVTTKGGKK